MKKITKLCILGLVLLIVGAAIFALGFATGDFTFDSLANNEYHMTSYTAQSTEINKIIIDLDMTNVKIVRSEEQDKVSIEYPTYYNKRGNTLEEIFITDKNGTIKMEEKLIKSWQINLFYFESATLTLTLPSSMITTLDISTDTGDVTLIENDGSRYESIMIDTDTGDVESVGTLSANGAVCIESDTGSITLDYVNSEKLSVDTGTGDTKLKGGNVRGGIELNTDTGDIELEEDLTASTIVIDSDTGDLELSDGTVIANEIFIETDTGDIEIKLFGNYADYKVMLDMDSSDVNINPSNGGPRKLEISSDTGDALVYFTE